MVGISILIAIVSLYILTKSLRKNVIKPTKNLIGLMQALSVGDISTGMNDFGKQDDEIGVLQKSAAMLSEAIGTQTRAMQLIAAGDYSERVPVRSESDIINKAINDMIDKNNSAMSAIRSASTQIFTGSGQISGGAQTLAQGAAEQADTVQEISAEIAGIANKAKYNAEMAGNSAMLAASIMQNAEKGSRQMDEMIDAVNAINQSSQNIQKVIKVIDDIAFQTNILALNASVEAARAGQHGKGFAVVADEVRNLAAKSTAAAKDTSELIADSLEKAKLGTRIAEETAASFGEIVSGIGESNQIAGEIAKSSEGQTADIEQINNGIDRVAQVIHQNSATAEESAAASKEMSEQSAMLQQLVAQFKLKNDISKRDTN
jgi:methyl-accepting chemotaxis protein